VFLPPAAGDGLYTFDIVKKGSDLYDLSTALEIQAATVSLLNLCGKDVGGRGGIATNIGKSKAWSTHPFVIQPVKVTIPKASAAI